MQDSVVTEVLQPPEMAAGYIFNGPAFQALKGGNNRYFVLQKNTKIYARTGFRINGKTAISGFGATFGSIDCLSEVTQGQRAFFLQQVCQKLAKSGISAVTIRHRPQAYGDNWHDIFLNSGFTVAGQEVNQHLAVTAKDFYQRIKYNEQKKLKQALNRGYVFRQLTIRELPEVYALVTATRNRKGYPVSMGFTELEAVFRALPDNYLLFGLYAGHELIAAAVSIRVSAGVLYNFYHADAMAYRSTSPLVMLLSRIYAYCREQGIATLDLGISSANGHLNQGLFTFKQNLGCEPSDKNTYRLQL